VMPVRVSQTGFSPFLLTVIRFLAHTVGPIYHVNYPDQVYQIALTG